MLPVNVCEWVTRAIWIRFGWIVSAYFPICRNVNTSIHISETFPAIRYWLLNGQMQTNSKSIKIYLGNCVSFNVYSSNQNVLSISVATINYIVVFSCIKYILWLYVCVWMWDESKCRKETTRFFTLLILNDANAMKDLFFVRKNINAMHTNAHIAEISFGIILDVIQTLNFNE